MSTISDILLETFNNVVELQTNMCERKFASIIIPKEVKSVGNYAFAGCEDLTKVDFSSKPNSIADTAFLNCQNLAEINAPWRMGGIPGAPWGADNAIIHYLPTVEDVSLNISRIESVEIYAPTGENYSANIYATCKFGGDGYISTFTIEADNPTLYIYNGLSNEHGFHDDYIEITLKYFDASTNKYYYSNEFLYIDNFTDLSNLILNSPDVYPIEYFILANCDYADYDINLLGGNLYATSTLKLVGRKFAYNVNLSGNLPIEELETRLTCKTDGTYVDGIMGNTCSEIFEVECYDIYVTNDEDIISSTDAELIKNKFLSFAYEKAYPLREGPNFDAPIENIFEISY